MRFLLDFPSSSCPSTCNLYGLLMVGTAIAEPPKRPYGGARLLEKLFVMLVVCTKRRETNHVRPISSAIPQRNQYFLFTRALRRARLMTGTLHPQLAACRQDHQPMSPLITPLLELVPEVAGVMAWAVSRAAAGVPPSITVFPKQPNSRSPRQVALRPPPTLIEHHREQRA